MKEKLLIVGAGGLGRITLEHAIANYDCCFIDDGLAIGNTVCDVPVLGGTDILPDLIQEYKKLIVAIGNNSIRQKIYLKAKEIGYIFPNIISESVYISPFAQIGRGCIFLNNAVVQNGATIGDGVVLNTGVEIHHDCTIGNYVLIYANSVIRTEARVDDRVKIGSNVTISNGVVVKADDIIQDGYTVLG